MHHIKFRRHDPRGRTEPPLKGSRLGEEFVDYLPKATLAEVVKRHKVKCKSLKLWVMQKAVKAHFLGFRELLSAREIDESIIFDYAERRCGIEVLEEDHRARVVHRIIQVVNEKRNWKLQD